MLGPELLAGMIYISMCRLGEALSEEEEKIDSGTFILMTIIIVSNVIYASHWLPCTEFYFIML